jgi:hypothetical protein
MEGLPMTEVKSRLAPPDVILGNLANLFAALAVASQFFWQVFAVSGSAASATSALRWLDLMPAVVLLVAVGLALVPALRRFGWLVSVVGLLGLIGLYAQDRLLPADLLYLALAVVLGVQLGGVLLAFAGVGPRARWLIATGAGVGLVGGGSLLGLLGELLAQSDALAGYLDESVVAVSVVVTAVAGVWLARRPGPAAPGPAPGPALGATRARSALISIAVAVVAARVLTVVWRLVLDRIAQASTGGFSQERAQTVEALNRAVLLAIASVVAVVLLVAAYRRGGAHLARMVVAVFAVSVIALEVGRPTIEATGGDGAVLLEVALIGGAVAVGLVILADRVFPWDAVGVLLLAAGVLGDSSGSGWSGVAVVLGLAWTLAAGLARLGGTPRAWTSEGWPGGGLSGGEVGLSAALGFVTLILASQVLGGHGPSGGAALDGPPVDQALTLLAAAVLLVLLFLRQPRSVPAPAPADADVAPEAAVVSKAAVVSEAEVPSG